MPTEPEQLDWVMPGDVVLRLTRSQGKVAIGRGLRQDKDRIIATKAGRYFKPTAQRMGKHMVISDEKAYTPRVEEPVVGIVRRGGSFNMGYFIDLGSGVLAKLDSIAFDGASKRNRPDLRPGAAVYCRVVTAIAALDTELSCCSLQRDKKDWMTGESLFGELKGGTVVRLHSGFCRRLLMPGDTILSTIGERVQFSMCVGVNGMVWVKAAATRDQARLVECLHHVEALLYGGDREDASTVADVISQKIPQSALPPAKRPRTETAQEGGGAEEGDNEDDEAFLHE
eukprot:TRINITY_DN959_c0_g3_i1.p1 TRINITY_DN959_c0_g3~~TRINITY_DN959_c0_g3_i1.p1  ORF type:complete len:311 (+),score=113.09 TRINITY_DN959_c0_g3_i1:84-935(+)